jgi:Rrf2 family iron-sulfur cluster assembly transcriptional regulator
MLYSKSSQYAIRAVAYLATKGQGKFCKLEEIAATESIPAQFLAKVLQKLVRKRLVRSSKGKHGGFALLKDPKAITLYSIVDAIEDLTYSWDECILGRETCTQENSCFLHDPWKELKQKQVDFLESITISEMIRQYKLPNFEQRQEDHKVS